MEHFGALNLRRRFFTTSIVATSCLSLALVVVPCLFHSAPPKRISIRKPISCISIEGAFASHDFPFSNEPLPYPGTNSKRENAAADDFNPQKGLWSYRLNQHNEAEKNSLLKRANALPQNEIKRADLLVTVIRCYGDYVSLSDQRMYALQALEILEPAYRQKQKKENPNLSPTSSPITAAKERIDASDVLHATGVLSNLCIQLAPPAVCNKTDVAYQIYQPNPEQRAKHLVNAKFWQERTKRAGPPGHDLAKIYQATGDKFQAAEHFIVGPPRHALAKIYQATGDEFQAAEHFKEAIDAFEKALKNDDLCFPDKTIMFCDYIGSGFGPTSPILTDCEALADAYMDAARYQEAAKIYRRAIATLSAIESAKKWNICFTGMRNDLNHGLNAAVRLAAQSAR
jgi:tetratricopeptide (TPR) repeat protein